MVVSRKNGNQVQEEFIEVEEYNLKEWTNSNA